MQNFIYHNNTKVYFGRDHENQIGSIVKALSSNILLVYGQNSVKKSGLLDLVKSKLDAEKILFTELNGIVPNPRLDKVEEGIKLVQTKKIDFILALGGGSVIDTAKAIAVGAVYDGDVFDFFTGKSQPKKALPTGCILTIPAAGSETSDSTVITRESDQLKRGLTSAILRPAFAILNPALTMSLSLNDTVIGSADIMSHVLERYFTQVENTLYSDRLCEATMRALVEVMPALIKSPNDYDLRAELMWIGLNAHSDLLGQGRIGDWSSHILEHELSGIYDIKHGAGLAIVFPAWMKHVYTTNKKRFVNFATQVWGISPEGRSEEEIIQAGIKSFEDYFKSLGLATRLSELSIKSEHFETMAQKSLDAWGGPVGMFKKLERQDIIEIYKKAL